MKQYLDLLNHIATNGNYRKDRTGTGTISVFGPQIRFDLTKGFPCLTTKKLHWKSIVHELLWFLKGDTNIKYLKDNGVSIWDEWADEDGNLGPVYGYQWRSWPCGNGVHVDQIRNVIDQIIHNPDSRRIMVSAWNVAFVDEMALPPCHCFFQFYVNGKDLYCKMYQRSADVFLGLPFNIASYALLTHLMAKVTGTNPRELIISLGDAHIYLNHIDQVHLQMTREPRPLPSLEIDNTIQIGTLLESVKYEDINLINYDPHPLIKADISV